MKLFIDDIRNPSDVGLINSEYVIARSYNEAIEWLKRIRFSYITFDHDLGAEKTGYDIVKWLVNYDMDTNYIGQNFVYNVHSANPIGAENIQKYLESYLKAKISLD